MRKLFYILPLLLALSGCSYILYHDPVQYSGAPKWQGSDDDFLVFDSWPTNHYQIICHFYAGSDIGNYPGNSGRYKLAVKYAKRYGGNGVVLGHDALGHGTTNSFADWYIIYVKK